jgi:hypothetical protein
MQSGFIEPLDYAVACAVREKVCKAGSYDWKGARERWLILVAEAHGTTDVFGQPKSIQLPDDVVNLPFTYIIIWDKFSESVWAIHPHFEVICDGHEQRRFTGWIPQSLRTYVTGDVRYQTRPVTR